MASEVYDVEAFDLEEVEEDNGVSVSLIACGLHAVPDDVDTQVSVINLHGNLISEIGSSLSLLVNLVELNLSSNQIQVMEGFDSLLQLRSLNLACNKISKVRGLAKLRMLATLNLSHNVVVDLSGLYDIVAEAEGGGVLRELRLKDNNLLSLQDLLPLRNVSKLNLLELENNVDGFTNPLCQAVGYYKDVLHILPQVKVLDPSSQSQSVIQSERGGSKGEKGEALVADTKLSSSPSAAGVAETEATMASSSSSISTQTEGKAVPGEVSHLEQEAKTLGEQLETLKSSFQDYDSLRSLVGNLKEQQRTQLERQEKVLKQEMEIFIQEKDMENQSLRHQAERSKSNENRLARELADAKQMESKKARELKDLNDTYARALSELQTLEEFAEQLTGKIEVERALRQRAEMESQGIMKKLNSNLSEFASVSHKSSQLQEKLFHMERNEAAFQEKSREIEESLQACYKKLADKEKQKDELREKLGRMNDSLNEMADNLSKERSAKAKLRDDLDEEYGDKLSMMRKNETRKVKDMLFSWFDKMESSCNDLKKSVHTSLVGNEQRLNNLFISKSRLSSAIIKSNKRMNGAVKEKRETENLLEELARLSEGLQSKLAHSHAEQNQLKKLISQQGKQIERYIPMSKKYHKLCLNYESLEKKYNEECDKTRNFERQCSDLQLKSAKAVQEAENSKIVSREELQRAEATLKQALAQESKLQHFQDEINTLGQVIKLKDTLLDDRNKSIEELTASIKREQDDKAVIVESHSLALEQMKSTMDSLNDELNLQDQIVQRQKEETSRLELELKENTVKTKEKDDMLQYVRLEIENLKTMFQAREDKLREECKLANQKAMDTFKDKEKADLELQKSTSAVEALVSKLNDKDEKLVQTSEELRQSKKNVESVENEMRQLLKALENERQASQMKAQRVQSVLKELAIP